MSSYRCALVVSFMVLSAAHSTALAASGDDLIALAKSGVDEEVVKAYIENAIGPFTLTSDEVVTLKDLGVPSKLIVEALGHDRQNDTVLNAETTATAAETAPGQSGPEAVSPVTAPSPDEQNISFFYSALYPYGTWINVDGTWCWQPNAAVIDDDWAPYCNHGHWVLTDYGWTWVSGYTWGWAPFHYGRWFRHEHYGWLWLPDNEWGPAWVAWRTGSDYCGWAPLPPRSRFEPRRGFFFGATVVNDDLDFGLSYSDFFFVPIDHFSDRHPFAHVVPSSRAGDIYKRTAFEKNSYSYANNHLVNVGVSVSAVEKGTKTRIAPVTLTEDRLRQGEAIHTSTVNNTKLLIYKPALSTATPQSPVTVRDRFTRNTETYGKLITPQANPQSWDARQTGQRNAAALAAKNQTAAAQTALTEQNRLDKEAQKETDQPKQAALKGEAAVQGLRVQQAQQHAQRAQAWKPPQEIVVPRIQHAAPPEPVRPQPVRGETKQAAAPAPAPQIRQPAVSAPVVRPTEQFRQQVRELNTEAHVEQQRKESVESTVRAQAQTQWQQQQRQPAQRDESQRKR